MEAKVKCPNCGQDTPAGKRFCGHCGARLIFEAPQKVFCPSCKAENQPDQQFCSTCGAQLAAPAPATTLSHPPPTGVIRPVLKQEQVVVKPTWGLAWGLWWRTLLLSLLVSAVIYLIAMVVTVALFGWSWRFPFSS